MAKRGTKVQVDLDDIEELAAEGNTAEDIADALGICRATIYNRKDIRAALDRGRAKLVLNIRHWQMQQAKAGDKTMLIWLGKQYLGQADSIENRVEIEPVKVVVDV